MSLVELRTYYDRFEAEIVCGRLRAEGLDAILFDVGLAATHGALPVRVMVLEEDRAAALDILAQDAHD
ncbi:MAG TPA: DUF2007 domain-containing protein [Allosphingosinicella sp.]|jgi:hypothetical protein|nr:DUF2007 domain-containing protein [Allosphingosinicella sp.]